MESHHGSGWREANKETLSRRCVVCVDPATTHRFRQPAGKKGNTTMAHLEHFALYAANSSALKDFYVDALGMTVAIKSQQSRLPRESRLATRSCTGSRRRTARSQPSIGGCRCECTPCSNRFPSACSSLLRQTICRRGSKQPGSSCWKLRALSKLQHAHHRELRRPRQASLMGP